MGVTLTQLWWTPPALALFLALFLARQAGRLAFALLRAWIRILVEVGARDLACRTIERAMRKLDARAREMRERRG